MNRLAAYYDRKEGAAAQARYWLLLQESAMNWQHINREAGTFYLTRPAA